MDYTTTIKVQPAVLRWLRNNFERKEGAIDLRPSPCYAYISAALSRSNVRGGSKICKRYDQYRPVKLFISGNDFRDYGWQISEVQQCKINQVFYTMLMQEACRDIASLHVGTGIPRLRVLNQYIEIHRYTEAELKPGSLMKYYQRHYMKKEQELYDLLEDLLDED